MHGARWSACLSVLADTLPQTVFHVRTRFCAASGGNSPRTCRPAKDAWQRERETAGAEGASGSPDYGLTTKAGVGFTLRLLILQLPASD